MTSVTTIRQSRLFIRTLAHRSSDFFSFLVNSSTDKRTILSPPTTTGNTSIQFEHISLVSTHILRDHFLSRAIGEKKKLSVQLINYKTERNLSEYPRRDLFISLVLISRKLSVLFSSELNLQVVVFDIFTQVLDKRKLFFFYLEVIININKRINKSASSERKKILMNNFSQRIIY